jgi:hypothetical protein
MSPVELLVTVVRPRCADCDLGCSGAFADWDGWRRCEHHLLHEYRRDISNSLVLTMPRSRIFPPVADVVIRAANPRQLNGPDWMLTMTGDCAGLRAWVR